MNVDLEQAAGRGGIGALRSERARAAVVAASTLALGLVIVGQTAGPLSDFTVTHHLFRYQDGFVRRAFIGSVIGALRGGGPVPEGLPLLLGFGFLTVLLGIAAVLVGLAALRGEPRVALLLAALLVGSSQLRILSFDIGKLDGLLLAFTATVALSSLGTRRLAIAVAILLSFVGVLVHELHLVAGVPLAATLVACRHGRDRWDRLRLMAIVGVPASLLGAALALASGRMPGGSQEAAEALLEARAAFPVSVSSAYVQGLSLIESAVLTFDWVSNNRTAVLATVLTAVPGTVAALLLLIRGRPAPCGSGRDPSRTVALAALAPLILLAVGFDWYRWLTILTVNLIVAGLWRQAAQVLGSSPSAPPTARPEVPDLSTLAAVLVSIMLAAASPVAGVSGLLEILS